MSSNIEITKDGISVPETSEIKSAFQSIFTSAMGSDLTLDDSTPQGVLIDGLTIAKQQANSSDLLLFNQMNPSTAEGVWQNAIASLFGLERKPATYSVVSCVCIGRAGTVLNGIDSENPAMAQSTSGDIFRCLGGGTIPASGSITLQFIAEKSGKIPVGANSITKIYQPIAGWDTINNPNDGVVGEDVESREDFENRRKESLALNATGSLSSVYSKVYNVNGVTDLFVWENDLNTSVTYRGITLGPHSIYVCQNGANPVSGGTGSGSLAEAIYNSKSAGCDTNNDSNNPLTCTYTDSLTGVDYTYKYYVPTNLNLYIQVNLAAGISDELKQKVKEAFASEFNGSSIVGNSKITIGTTIYASRFYEVVKAVDEKNITLESIKISSNGSSWVDVMQLNMNILPVLNIESTSPSYVVFNVGS